MANPFVSNPSVNTHNGFTPAKHTGPPGITQALAAPVITIKPPKPPEKPHGGPYMKFSRHVWQKVREENPPDAPVSDIGKKIGAMWRELPPREKQIYQEQWEVEKIEYDKQLRAYHNSAPYQAYLAQKNQAERAIGRERRAQVESGVFVQAVDEDDGEFQATVRRVAAQRFDKNHRLIGEIFRSSNVFDTRTIVTQQRIAMLKRQASSLTTHQENLEKEIQELGSRFTTKRKLMEEASENFSEQLKKACSKKPELDEGKYEQMIQQASEKLLSEYQIYKEKQLAAEKGSEETAANQAETKQNGEAASEAETSTSIEGDSEGLLPKPEVPVCVETSNGVTEPPAAEGSESEKAKTPDTTT